MSRFRTSVDRWGAYKISEQALVDLYGIVAEFVGEAPEITINFEGDRNLSSENLRELLADTLVQVETIQECRISGSGRLTQDRRSASVVLRPSRMLPPVSISLSGPPASCTLALSNFEARLKASKLWYSSLRGFGSKSGFLSFLVACVVCFVLAVGFNSFTGNHPQENGLYAFIILGQTVGLIIALNWFTKRFAPPLLFDFGRSARRVRSMELAHQILLVTIALGVVVGVVATWVAQRLFGG